MNSTLPIIGQLSSIVVQAAAACFMFYLMGDMRYGLYYTLVNKVRHLYFSDRSRFILSMLGMFVFMFIASSLLLFNVLNVIIAALLVVGAIWALILIIKKDRLKVYSQTELETFNEPFLWLKENPVYYWYMIKGWSTLGICFGLLHQLALNQIYTKPKEFFISSPLSGLSFVFILIHLVSIIKSQEKKLLQHRLGKAFADQGIK